MLGAYIAVYLFGALLLLGCVVLVGLVGLFFFHAGRGFLTALREYGLLPSLPSWCKLRRSANVKAS